MKLVTFSSIAGVPIYYARSPVAKYGTKGKGPRTVRLEQKFHDQLEACLGDLWATCPWGKPEALVSGGCYVEKAGKHGEGRAIDIDAIWWLGAKRYPLVTRDVIKNGYPVLYLGVEAILRKHLGMVLDYWYNYAHEDHWHCDNGTPIGFRPGARNQALFIQAALTYVYGIDVGSIDGVVGPKTCNGFAAAMSSSLTSTAVGSISKLWVEFTQLTATRAFTQIMG